jgi:hypothetical protein
VQMPDCVNHPRALFPPDRAYTLGLMNALDILFRSSHFNLSKTGEHFINLCCYWRRLCSVARSQIGCEEC